MFVGTIKSLAPNRSLGGALSEAKSRRRKTGVTTAAAGGENNQPSRPSLRQRFHECENRSAHRIIFVVELDQGEMIRAFEHQLLNRFIARRPQSFGEPVRI